MKTPTLRRRVPLGTPEGWAEAVHPVLRQVYAARGVLHPAQAEHRLRHLLAPRALGGLDRAVELLIEAIAGDWSIVIAGDYDCDGATGTAVAVRGLRLLGARRVGYTIPNRFVHGYGLSPALVDSLEPAPQLIVTVDNGVASVAGVAAAKARGIRVIVTDHHLPGEQLPAADALVNPNVLEVRACGHGEPACAQCVADAHMNQAFPSRALAGVGVMFYLLLAVRARLYPCDLPDRQDQKAAIHGRTLHKSDRPDLSSLLDLVALGTVADLVPLDFNNRVLVEAGLKRIRSGHACVGITALVEAGKRSLASVCASDLGYAVGPRLNAAGRLEDMRLGVECLLADDPAQARQLAERLSAINQERRDLQDAMVAEAEAMIGAIGLEGVGERTGVTLYEPSWHAGVVGLVASRLKERLHRPVIAFAPADEDRPDELRGSARSIAGFHVRDALAAIDARMPGLIERFGGHAMAAGLSLKARDYPRFAAAFDAIAREWLDEERLQAVLYTDGELPPGTLTLDLARQLRDGGPWGQGFPEPLFDNLFDCTQWRVMGERHWRLSLRDPRDGGVFEAVMFNVRAAAPPPRLRAVFELTINEWQGRETVRLLLRHLEPA
ncbi:single-stranded-DNA-specific exonuclease RecJ [Frateuria terrea]|uniref:Single-stranded-DNA-specific exonuclease RecJ n=1 Tax=Frateuria terrea TaxID=529704 RepID=A0A1H6UQS7_9GAMM|nr:single-stranded-DNA-specific exonuclease RecJ [Frateuria terrea]SEI92067.1 single-stranded-DNA-specific exonuclease [Frateuria terrea]SFP35563.1 single-stranded-DNA-specific exonuclease [Frateuria terrea]